MRVVLPLMSLLFASQMSGAVYLEPSAQFKPKIEVAAIYIEYKEMILLLHRQAEKSQGNRWGIPGGKVDKAEAPLQALIREVKEETGYDISNQKIDFVKTVFVEHNAKDHLIYHMYRTILQDNPGDVKINFTEHKGFTWVTPADGLKMHLIEDEDPCIRIAYPVLKM